MNYLKALKGQPLTSAMGVNRIPHFAEFLSTEDQGVGDLRLPKEVGDQLARQTLSLVSNECSADPSRAAPGRKPTASVTVVQLKLLL